MREHTLIAAVYQMSIDVKEKQMTGCTGVWSGDERRKQPRAEVDEAAYVPQRFQLMTEKDRLIRRCRIVWIQQNRIGVAFETESGD